MSLEEYVPSECPKGGGDSCRPCVVMCEQRPCWPTPTEAQALISAGYSDRLMDDYWAGGGGPDGDEDIHLLSPAIVGRESGNAPFWPNGRCTFLSPEGLCELHDLGLKPFEGRVASCADDNTKGLHKAVALEWNNPKSQELVAKWRRRR